MKNQHAVNFRVGLFVLLAVCTFVAITVILSGERKFFEKSYVLTSSFDNTAGLIKGAAVRLSGVRIGSVTKIGFESDAADNNSITVKMRVNKNGMKRINPDAKATIRTEGLLGDKYVELMPGKIEPPTKLPDEMFIESYTPVELSSLIGQSGELLTNIISISESLDQIVKTFENKENLENINQTLLSLRASSEALQKNMEAIENGDGILHTMIYGPETKSGKKLDENTLVQLNKLITNVNEGDGLLHALIFDKKFNKDIDATLANLNTATSKLNGEDGVMTELQETMSNFREISEMLRGGEGTLGALLIDPSIYDSLKGVLGEAERSKFVRSAVKYMTENQNSKNSEKSSD